MHSSTLLCFFLNSWVTSDFYFHFFCIFCIFCKSCKHASQRRPLTALDLDYMYCNKLGGDASSNGSSSSGGGVKLSVFLKFYKWWKGVLFIISDINELWTSNKVAGSLYFFSSCVCSVKRVPNSLGFIFFDCRISKSKTRRIEFGALCSGYFYYSF